MIDLYREYSKEIIVCKGKKFLIDNLLKSNSSVKKLEIYALSAAISGEVTTLIYQSEIDNQEILLLGFYDNYWSDSDVVYQGYGFKNFDTVKALEILIYNKN